MPPHSAPWLCATMTTRRREFRSAEPVPPVSHLESKLFSMSLWHVVLSGRGEGFTRACKKTSTSSLFHHLVPKAGCLTFLALSLFSCAQPQIFLSKQCEGAGGVPTFLSTSPCPLVFPWPRTSGSMMASPLSLVRYERELCSSCFFSRRGLVFTLVCVTRVLAVACSLHLLQTHKR